MVHIPVDIAETSDLDLDKESECADDDGESGTEELYFKPRFNTDVEEWAPVEDSP